VSLYDALDSELLLIPGVLPKAGVATDADLRSPAGRRAFYECVHEQWLATGGHVLAVNGIAPERESEEDAVLSFGREVPSLERIPSWSVPLARILTDSGLRVGVFDGAARHVAFEGSGQPAFEYARHFADEQMALVWLSSRAREHWITIQEDDRTGPRLVRAKAPARELDVAGRAGEIASCLAAHESSAARCPGLFSANCDFGHQEAALERYARTQNPYDLLASMPAAPGCSLEWLLDHESQQLWLLSMGGGKARLVPLQGVIPARTGGAPLPPASLRAAVSLGIAKIVIGP
jgi:hypothetical protein